MLQGSLDNFALEEILVLLSDTTKTGQLEVVGNRGNGKLIFSDGKLAGAMASSCDSKAKSEDVLFELLRFEDGKFAFSPCSVDPSSSTLEVQTVLRAAESRFADWADISKVVPSLSHAVTPIPELPEETVTIDRSEWSVLTVIGDGCSVSVVCDELNLGEIEGSRRVKDLVERGLIVLHPMSSKVSSLGSDPGPSSTIGLVSRSTAVPGSRPGVGSDITATAETISELVSGDTPVSSGASSSSDSHVSKAGSSDSGKETAPVSSNTASRSGDGGPLENRLPSQGSVDSSLASLSAHRGVSSSTSSSMSEQDRVATETSPPLAKREKSQSLTVPPIPPASEYGVSSEAPETTSESQDSGQASEGLLMRYLKGGEE